MDSHLQSVHSQLEIISPDGKIEFRDLDPAKGATHIGQLPENDIVLSGPGAVPRHARLDHSERPLRAVLLSAEGEATLQGQRLPANTPAEMYHGDALQLAGYTFILLEGEPAADTGQPQAPFMLLAIPPDQKDELIVAEIPKREWTVNVQETAVMEVAVANGGTLVAEFRIAVEGLDQGWLQVYPAEVNLNEGARATVSIAIAPPRLPTSRAGMHPFNIVVTSPTYPGHVTRLGASLTINPYYAFTVGDLAPRRQVIGRGQEAGEAALEIHNDGNSEASFLLEAGDDERVCRYEFQVAKEGPRLLNQAQIAIAPRSGVATEDGAATVHIAIRPKKRPLVAFRSRAHEYTVTVSPGTGKEAARSLPGQVQVTPLIGPWLLALLVLGLAMLIVVSFWPQARSFSVEPAVVPLGAPVSLNWRVSGVSRASIRAGTAEPPFTQLDQPAGTLRVTPGAPGKVTYQVEASNLLSRLSPQWLGDWLQKLGGRFRTSYSYSIQVLTPTPTPLPPPVIQAFFVEPAEIVEGQSVNIEWAVAGATSVLIDSPLGTVEPGQGKARHVPEATGVFTYVLVASNGTVVATQNAYLGITPAPTATPTPQAPIIRYFDLSTADLVLGSDSAVTLYWEVEGETTEITIKGNDIPDVSVAQKGEMKFRPGSAKNYMFVLVAKNGDLTTSRDAQLNVLAPTPTATATPTPTPTGTPLPGPKIKFFRAEGAVDCNKNSAACPGGSYCDVRGTGEVALRWEVTNLFPGDQVSVKRGAEYVSEPSQQGQGFLTVKESWIPGRFTLQVESGRLPGGSASARLCLERQAPPPPYNVRGGPDDSDPDKLKIEWAYSASDLAYIAGFRIYRIDYSTGTQFEPAYETADTMKRDWTDQRAGTCGRGYYVVALYRTSSGDLVETAPSNSWYSSPCP